MAVLRVLSMAGDESFEYEPEVDDERLHRARRVFDETLRRGWMAFVPGAPPARRGAQLRRFDPSAREIILQPPLVGG